MWVASPERSSIEKAEPIICDCSQAHDISVASMGRNYLWHRDGDAINAVLAAAGYNLRRLIKWLSFFLFEILARLNLELEVSAV